jgi:hypothetical protein
MIEKIAFSLPGGTVDSPKQIEINSIGGMPDGGVNLTNVVQNLLGLIFVFAGILALLFVIWGGISWITSGGEKEKIEEARKKIIYALIGLIVIFASFFIVNTVGGVVGISPFNLTGKIECHGNPTDLGCYSTICNPQTHQWECTGGK